MCQSECVGVMGDVLISHLGKLDNKYSMNKRGFIEILWQIVLLKHTKCLTLKNIVKNITPKITVQYNVRWCNLTNKQNIV